MLDDKTEIIAHFIGLFELNSEAARLKIEYQEFLAQLAQNPDLQPLLNVTVNVTSGYGLGDFIPNLSWPLSFVTVPNANFSLVLPFAAGYLPFFGQSFFPADIFNPETWGNPAAYAEPNFVIPPPSSMANITVQANYLEDHDRFGSDEEIDFVDPTAFDEGLQELVDVANTLQVIRSPNLPQNEDAIVESGIDIVSAINDLQETGVAPGTDGAEVHAAFDGDVVGVTVNGESQEDMPKISDHSHRFAEKEEETEEDPVQILTEDDEPLDHEVTTGENVLLNEASITTNWLDAPIISVMGEAVFAKAISQVNVWNDTDLINGEVFGSNGSSTSTFNAAKFNSESNPGVTYAEGEDVPDGPKHVAVTTIDGNLINYNHVCQYNFANDNDIASVEFSASDSYIQMGGNTLFNTSSVFGLGFHYDMIIVGGDMFDITYLAQTNIMLDADMVHHQEGFGGALETSNNVLFNWASIYDFGVDATEDMNEDVASASNSVANGGKSIGSGIMGDEVFAGHDVFSVLYITGSWLDVQIVEQINILGDSDQVAFASAAMQSAEGANVSVTTGKNELINVAAVTDAGLDSTIYTAEGAYSDAFLYQADFVSEDDPLMLLDTDPLAGEAVLFLADGMLEPDQGSEDPGIAAPLPTETSIDVMQSVLA